MHCSRCGAEYDNDAKVCQKCGQPLGTPSAAVVAGGKADPAIWNPDAAANWSLIFSPAFGAYIHSLNWETLNEPQKAASAKTWFYISLVILVIYQFIQDEGTVRILAFLYLLVWYFAAGRSQGKFVKKKFGDDYPRKPWGKALLIGLGCIVAYVFLCAILIGIFGIARKP